MLLDQKLLRFIIFAVGMFVFPRTTSKYASPKNALFFSQILKEVLLAVEKKVLILLGIETCLLGVTQALKD